MPNSVVDTIEAIEAIDDNGAKLGGVLKVWAVDNPAVRQIDANPHFNRAGLPTRALMLIDLALEGGAAIKPMVTYGSPTKDTIKTKMRGFVEKWAKLIAIPHVVVPSRSRVAPRYGVGEQIFVKAPADLPRWALGNVKLTVAPSGSGSVNKLASGRYIFTALDTWPGATKEVTVGYRLANGLIKSPELGQLKFTIVRPQTCSLLHLKDIHYVGGTPAPDGRGGPWNPDPNGGFLATHLIGPADVSFARIDVHERANGNVWTATGGRASTTRILGPTGNRLLGQTHGTPDGARHGVTDMERWVHSGPPELTAEILTSQPLSWVTAAGTCVGTDSVYSPILGVSAAFDNDLSAPASATVVAEAGIDIELHYRIHKVGADAEIPNQRIGTNRHEISLTTCGTLTVSKGGITKTFRRDHVNVS